MKVRNLLNKLCSSRVALAASLMVAGAPAFADTSSIDVSATTGLISGDATAAVVALGGAFLAFKYLKKVWNRI